MGIRPPSQHKKTYVLEEMAMETRKEVLWKEGEYTYPLSFGFMPNIRAYLHEEGNELRPCVVMVPGGGYSMCAPAEGEPVAKRFYEMGFQTFVLTYTTNLLAQVPLGKQPMRDLARAIRMIRSHAAQYGIDPERVILCGFSAGAHLCGSLCVHFDDVSEEDSSLREYSARPDAAILSYPLVTTGDHRHEASFRALLGDISLSGSDDKSSDANGSDPKNSDIKVCQPNVSELEYYSIEKQVRRDMPPCFVWQTVTDEEVPMENSALLAQALKEKEVPFAYHLFTSGPHGMALADEDWAENRFGEPYTMEQISCLVQAIREGMLGQSEELRALADFFSNPHALDAGDKKADEEVAQWPEMACRWLRKVGILN